MTTETRVFIDPRDIIGIEFECPHCHARLCCSLKQSSKLPYKCSNCGQRLIEEKSPDSNAVEQTIYQLGDIIDRKITNNGKDLIIRFELAKGIQ